MAATLTYKVRAIRHSDKFSNISSGSSAYTPLKTFLKRRALYYEDYRLARTYGVFVQPADEVIVGYMTLVCSEIDLGKNATLHPGEMEETRKTYPYTTYPALKIARLLIDSRHRTAGIGTTLVRYAFSVANLAICPKVGCRFIVVDSKRQAVDFYQKCGFTLVDTKDNLSLKSPVMFVDLKGVDDLVAQSGSNNRPARRAVSGGTYQPD